MGRPLPDQFDIIHTEDGSHMTVLGFDEKSKSFLVSCPHCKMRLVVSLYEEKEPEKAVVEGVVDEAASASFMMEKVVEKKEGSGLELKPKLPRKKSREPIS